MTMTARQILANTSRDRILLSRDISYKFPKGDPTPGVRIVRAKVRSNLKVDGTPKPGKGDVYDVSVKALDEKLALSRGPVEVSCSCGDFVFKGWEYALFKQGAAKILYGNGEKPKITNPKLIPGSCKHIAGLLRLLVDYKI
jgi:hypothetical protein